MKKLVFLLFLLATLFYPSWLLADDFSLGFSAGYAWSDHGSINDAGATAPNAINQNGFSMGAEIWGGNKIQWGFILGILNPYRDDNPGDGNSLNYFTFQLMFSFRLRLFEGFYFGGATGYQLAIKRPDNRDYGDDSIVAMLLTGYDFNVSSKIVVSPGFRVLWAFEKSHVFTSYMPVVSIGYKF